MAPSVFKLIRNILGDELHTATFERITNAVESHYQPKLSEIVQRYRFNTRTRNSGETVAVYVAALRDIAQDCNYGDTLKEMIRDRLVCGINHEGIQRKLLAEKSLDIDKAYALALSIEAAERDSKDLRNPPTPQLVQYQASSNPPKLDAVTCYRCGGPHLATVCKHLTTVCNNCKKRGHLARVCKSSRAKQWRPAEQKQSETNKFVGTETGTANEQVDRDDAYEVLKTLRNSEQEPIIMDLHLNDVHVQMELDTGASVSVLNQATYERISKNGALPPLQPPQVKLKSYTGEAIPVLGTTTLKARYKAKKCDVVVHVVSGDGPNLWGRNWLTLFEVKLDSNCLNRVEPSQALQTVLQKHSKVFSEQLGCFNGPPVHLYLDEKVKPKYHKPRKVPFSLKEKVDKELERLQDDGIISPVKYSKWAAPVVPVLKRDGTVRLCGDYKVTVNQALIAETYPLPVVDDLLAALARGKVFSKLDMSNAYLQLPLDEASQQHVVINTHKGLFKYHRLPFGVSTAPSIFQRCMDSVLQGLEGVVAFIDDVLVTGETEEEHLQNLDAALQRLEEADFTLKNIKCSFMQPEIDFLGYHIDADGRHPMDEKIRAIKEAPTPKNVSELRAFLGLVNYYSKFLPNLSTTLRPLYILLLKHRKWTWGPEQEKAFNAAKQALQHNSVLVHFDPKKQLVLACDASPYGIGAVLSHVMEDGTERPIAYTSRTLNQAEQNYSQLEREALAIVSGVKKFHPYLYGRQFTIQSDHKPLSFLFHESKSIPPMASSRVQRWALALSAYQYNIEYKAGSRLCHADGLSRLPRPATIINDGQTPEMTFLINHLSSTCMTALHIKEWTSKDKTLSQVKRFILIGWPENLKDKELKPFFTRRDELSLLDGCVLWGTRVIVPPQGRKAILNELHETHPGASRMKTLARAYIWWPNMDADIEQLVRACSVCQESRPAPPSAPLHPWSWPSEPWSRLHIDFTGPFMGKMYLVLVDAHSKWMDVEIMSQITASQTIEKLRSIFAVHGLPKKVVSDNGPTFTSQEFQEFMERNGIVHVKSAPYHPSSNGLAERAVRSFKQGLKSITGKSVQEKLSKFLLKYRITPHSTTGIPPAEMLMKRRLRTKLDFLYPDVNKRVVQQQEKQKETHDNSFPIRTFKAGDLVYAENFTSSPRWIPATVLHSTGPLSYLVKTTDGREIRRHVDNLRARYQTQSANTEHKNSDLIDPLIFPDSPEPVVDSTPQSSPVVTGPRRSNRTHHPPDYYSK